MRNVCGILLLLFSLVIPNLVNGQPGTYILNGSATQNTCNCYTLTPAVNTQSGSVWNATKINLNNPFDFIFNVYLGCQDANGADGIVFILQPISTSVGASGGGMGFQGITPSIGVLLDTWQNTDMNDPPYDHFSIQANGVLNHGTDLAGPVQALASTPNIEDCQWHTLRITWDPVAKILRSTFDNVTTIQANADLIATYFNNDPMVYWGFSAGTGGSNNLQQFCTALNPSFTTNSSTGNVCFGTPVTFTNTSQSFAPIANFYWDFGDNTNTTSPNPPPHNYAAPGIYQVKLAITGLDGCFSDTLRKTITVGDYPLAAFSVFDTCQGLLPRVIDQSTVIIGSVSQWSWMLDGAPYSVSQIPSLLNLASGPHQLELTVTSSIGCAAQAPANHSFTIHPKPVIAGSVDDGCVNDLISFTGQQIDNATTITQWKWDFDDNNQTSGLQNPTHTYINQGNYDVTLEAISNIGCSSGVTTIPLFINKAVAFAGNDTMIIKNVPAQLNATGGPGYAWTPATGLSDAGIGNPLVTLQDDQTYLLTVTTPEGCIDTDEILVEVFKGSAVYVPTAFTPNNDGLNDRLKPYYIGIQKLYYFTVFNRWGEMVFTTKNLAAGWDGTIKGMPQATGSFVWVVKATDFVGKVYDLKGTVTIIR
jgi:gliding motility-associated-like protein